MYLILQSFLAELNRTTTKVDLAKYGEDLRSVANAVSGNAKTKLESAANRLDVIQTGSYKVFQRLLTWFNSFCRMSTTHK